ncbi:MAG: CpsB/CapC family capsule biosynthesis tyrosine phosphatase, partial [Bacillota bacterium]|nr:CpsB/CapC family capsule biosynthesis tyrosine phosphatase [Bacillota bacterium]
MHTHILPEIDDGAKSVKESLIILNRMRRHGVRTVCLTPHFYTDLLSMDDFLIK